MERFNSRRILSASLACLVLTLLVQPVGLAAAENTPSPEGPRAGMMSLEQVALRLTPPVDVNQLMLEDEANRDRYDIPYRIGFPMDTDISPANSGSWEVLESGDSIWRLKIRSKDAIWVVLGFGTFKLQPGAELRVYDPQQNTVNGPYTFADIRSHGELWFPPIAGDTLVVEVLWPEELGAQQPNLHLTTVSHGYKPFGHIGLDDASDVPGSAGSCNIDVVCPEGDDWQDQERGAVQVLVGGSGNCSGALINTTANDCRTYLLTASHCGENGPSTTIGFNYECDTCGCTVDPGTINARTLTGGTLLADYSSSDMTLIEMDEAPLEEWGVYYVGWSRDPNPALSSAVISFPSGDVKKIAFDDDPPVDGSNWGANHWRIADAADGVTDPAHQGYELGTTEPASSGSPLMDQNHRIIGQLHGGTASCSSDTYDEYGKIDASWVGGGTPATRLSDWLDPLGTGAMFVDGVDHAVCLYQPAGQVLFTEDLYSCSDTLTITLRDDNIPGNPATFDVTVSSATEVSSETVTLNKINPDIGSYSGTIQSSTVPPVNGDSLLSVGHGDILTVNYVDADNGAGGVNVTIKDNANVDCVAPVISAVQAANVEARSAVIGFSTDEPTLGTVRYGLSCGALDQLQDSAELTVSQAIQVTGLADSSVYFFAVDAADAAGNGASDDNGGLCYTFTTPEIPDFFTELFETDNDTDFLRLAFTPNASPDFYEGCAVTIASFPSDPAGGTVLSLTDDSFETITLTGGNTVSLYGVSYSEFYVTSNGYITFNSGVTDYTESLAEHFDQPRISALYDDLNPASAGTVSWKEFADRVVVTFEGVTEYSQTNTNDFQVEMFFSGVIAINYLTVDVADGLAGLSDGSGLSPDYLDMDLSAMASCGDAACWDGILNQDEVRIDCGGVCPPCQCLTDPECDDDQFCTGVNSCNAYGICQPGSDPCPGQACHEDANQCVECFDDVICDDGQHCNGVETCRANSCQPGLDACPYGLCDEGLDACLTCDNDGTCEPGEDCANCPNDCISGSRPVCGNGVCEVPDGEDCLSCPEDCNGDQQGQPTTQFCCGDGVTGTNPVTCSDSRCTDIGITCATEPILAYCCGDATCNDIESVANCPADCTVTVPGEAGGGALLEVTGYDPATGMLSISFGVPCGATDHTLEYGELTHANLASYSWSNQECDLGMTGSFDWSTTGSPDAMFFVVVANNSIDAGSYGTDSSGLERPADVTPAVCETPQNLQYSCE